MTRTRSLLRQRGQARARMFISTKMGWLSGYPLAQKDGAIVWQMMPTNSGIQPQQLEITRTQLQQASFAYSKLTHRFPHALPRVVADIDAWRAGVPRLFAMLKASVHDGAALPRSLLNNQFFTAGTMRLSAEIAKTHPALSPILNALTWLTCLDPSSLISALKWVAANAPQLTTLLKRDADHVGLAHAMSFWELQQRDSAARVDPLLYMVTLTHNGQTLLAGDNLFFDHWSTQLHQCVHHNRQQPLNAFSKELSTGSNDLLAWLQWLFTARQTTRRRAFDLFAVLKLDSIVPLRGVWWRRVTSLLTPFVGTLPSVEDAKTLQEQIEQLQTDAPSELPLRMIVAQAGLFAERVSAETHRAILSSLAALPVEYDRMPVRAAFLDSWNGYFDHDYTKLGVWLQCRQRLLTPQLLPHLLASWSSVFSYWKNGRYFPHSPDLTLTDSSKPQHWSLSVDVLSQLLPSLSPLNRAHFVLLNSLCRLCNQQQWVTERFLALVNYAMEDEYDEFDFKALSLCAAVTETAADFALVYSKLDAKDFWKLDIAALQTVASQLAAAGWHSLPLGVITNNQLDHLLKLASLHKLLAKIDQTVTPPATPLPLTRADWIAAYPEEFGAYLAALAELSDNAKTVAQRVLGKAFPTQHQLSAEITHLQTLPSNRGIEKRLQNLQKRRKQTHQPSAHQVEKFGRKLQHAIWRAALDQWEAVMTSQLHTHLRSWLQTDSLPDWLSSQPELNMLVNLMELSTGWQNLGRSLLERRAGDPPWDMRDHPANAQFIAAKTKRGLAMQHWLTPPTQTVQTNNGQTVILRIDDDPLAVFQMGTHFNTCLAVGNFNFFSVFANAADINKRVLFAYDERQRVLGRCLIALSDSGGLLTFHPYCHHTELNFESLVTQFVTLWAEQLDTVVLPQGQVTNLVAFDWYDDGAVDLSQRFPFLENGSAWRKSLPSLDENEFVASLARAFAPLTLNEMTLPLVLALPELENRPKLILPLLPTIQSLKSLPQDSWLLILLHAQRANAQHFVEQSLDRHLIPYVRHILRGDDYWSLDERLWPILAEYRPSLALRLLRRSRPKHIVGEEHELSALRVEALLRVFELLNRPKRAAAMRRRLTSLNS